MGVFDQFAKNLYKTGYYTKGMARSLLPHSFWQHQLKRILENSETLPSAHRETIENRVNYYNKLDFHFELPEWLDLEHQLYKGKRSTAYRMDFTWWLSFFSKKPINYSYLFGDITHVPDLPTFLKSRPVAVDSSNKNSVILKLNQIRHYYIVKDKTNFEHKKPKIVWRGRSNNSERVEILSRFFDSSVCDVGDTHYPHKRTAYVRPFMTIPEQLNYRYVLSVEGNDVATNTKWIMASSSLCFMRKPRFETWFMEGALIPDYHYVQLRDDYSDLEEKIEYYNANPEHAKAIIANANRYVEQFQNHQQELLISLLVMQKYFKLSGQM